MKAGVCETLREVAEAVRAGETSTLALGNFLAFLKPASLENAIAEAPALLAGQHPSGAMVDAYLAATAELLAQRNGLQVPAWTEEPARFLHEVHFPSHSKRLNDLLYQESPDPFRRRGIIVSSNVLDVA